MKKFQTIDPHTGLHITFQETSVFSIAIASKNAKKYIHRVYDSAALEDALREFHQVIISKNQYKYLFQNDTENPLPGHGKMLYRNKGYAIQGYRAVRNRQNRQYISHKSMTIKSTPKAIMDRINEIDFKFLPMADTAWSLTKFVHVCLSHALAMSEKDLHDFIRKTLPTYYKFKISSGDKTPEPLEKVIELNEIKNKLQETENNEELKELFLEKNDGELL